MRFLITFVSLFLVTIFISNAQTLSRYSKGGQLWDITYATGTFADLENAGTDFSSLPWWGNVTNASDFGAGTHGSKPAGLRFAFAESSFSGSATVLYHDQSTASSDSGQVFQSASATYAIGATLVPAPLPILGILPVVGFLKRMRKRQRA